MIFFVLVICCYNFLFIEKKWICEIERITFYVCFNFEINSILLVRLGWLGKEVTEDSVIWYTATFINSRGWELRGGLIKENWLGFCEVIYTRKRLAEPYRKLSDHKQSVDLIWKFLFWLGSYCGRVLYRETRGVGMIKWFLE